MGEWEEETQLFKEILKLIQQGDSPERVNRTQPGVFSDKPRCCREYLPLGPSCHVCCSSRQVEKGMVFICWLFPVEGNWERYSLGLRVGSGSLGRRPWDGDWQAGLLGTLAVLREEAVGKWGGWTTVTAEHLSQGAALGGSRSGKSLQSSSPPRQGGRHAYPHTAQTLDTCYSQGGP